jgi:hypothetical protein
MTPTSLGGATGASTTTAAAALDRLAFDRTAPARAAMRLEDAPNFGLDAFAAAGKAISIVARVAPHRAALLGLPEFDISNLDCLEDYARALRFVHTEILRRVQRAKVLPVLAEEGKALRALMMSYAEALSYKGLFSPELIARLREGTGYADLVEDLNILAQEFLALPAAHTGPGSLVTRPEIDRASEIAHQINVASGNVVDIDLSQAALLDERRKVAGLLLEAHSEIRRAVTYLRWKQGDAAELVPSLYTGSQGRPKGAKPAEDVLPELAALHQEMHTLTGTPHVNPEDSPFAAE